MVTFKSIEGKYNPSQVIRVNGNPVWDYKFLEEENAVHLISEPVANVEKDYGLVTYAELAEYVGLFTDCVLVDECSHDFIKMEELS